MDREDQRTSFKISKQRVVDKLIANQMMFGTNDWAIYVDRDGEVDVRQNTFNNRGWIEISNFENFESNQNVDESYIIDSFPCKVAAQAVIDDFSNDNLNVKLNGFNEGKLPGLQYCNC